MKRLLLLATAASAVALSVAAPAAAQSWQAINQRQASIDQRIDQGIRSGSLTQQEGIQLRGEFRAIANLEADYRRTQGGLSAGERADLDRRFDQLARRVYAQKQDWQSQGSDWKTINQRQASIEERIETGVRSGALTSQETILLRGEFRTIANLEAQYRRTDGGLSSAERADLDRRFDNLSRRVYAQKQDQHGKPGQQWLTINQRQADLDQRIDQGVRNGALTQQETILLRGEFRTIANLEAQYRRTDGGLSTAERADLDRRFDDLSRRIYVQKQDRQDRR